MNDYTKDIEVLEDVKNSVEFYEGDKPEYSDAITHAIEAMQELTALKDRITVERIARIMAGKYINWKGYLKHAQRVVKNLKGEK